MEISTCRQLYLPGWHNAVLPSGHNAELEYLDSGDALKQGVGRDDMLEPDARGLVIGFRQVPQDSTADLRYAQHLMGSNVQLYRHLFAREKLA